MCERVSLKKLCERYLFKIMLRIKLVDRATNRSTVVQVASTTLLADFQGSEIAQFSHLEAEQQALSVRGEVFV